MYYKVVIVGSPKYGEASVAFRRPSLVAKQKKVMCCMSWTHTILDGDSWSPPAILQGGHTRAIRETDGELSHLPLIETCV